MLRLPIFPRCAKYLVFAAFPLVPIASLAQDPACSVGSANIQIPGVAGVVQGSPASVVISAQVGRPDSSPPSGCEITALRLYVDNQSNQIIYVSAPSAQAGFNPSLPNGIYNLVGVAYDNLGYAFVTNSLQLYVGNTDRTVYVETPVVGKSSSDAVTIIAYTRWDSHLQGSEGANQTIFMRAYVDDQDVFHSTTPVLGFQKTFSPGYHRLVIVSYNGNGDEFLKSQTIPFTVP